jgi:hypothetical protein
VEGQATRGVLSRLSLPSERLGHIHRGRQGSSTTRSRRGHRRVHGGAVPARRQGAEHRRRDGADAARRVDRLPAERSEAGSGGSRGRSRDVNPNGSVSAPELRREGSASELTVSQKCPNSRGKDVSSR